MVQEYSTPGATAGFPSYRFPTGPMSPQSPNTSFDVAAAQYNPDKLNGRGDGSWLSSIIMRRLPMNTSQDSLRSMLIFAKDCINVDFVSQKVPDDAGYLTAIASFRSATGAEEARQMLDGKQMSEARLIVEVITLTPGGGIRRGNPLENQRPSDPGPISSTGQLNRSSSKFNSTFQQLDRAQPGRMPSFGSGSDTPHRPDAGSYPQMFAPQSPPGHPLERQRVSGKSVIGEDGVDDDTGKLLHDPVAYAQNENNHAANAHGGGVNGGHDHGPGPMPGPTRRSTMPHIPTSRFASLTLNSSAAAPSPTSTGLISPRGPGPMQSPTAFAQPGMGPPPFSPTGGPNGPNGGPGINERGSSGPNYPLPSPHYLPSHHPHHPTFPPVNPADQNPPCNTLYVGNLPIDTAEDELKALFSKQRGYRRLCFRTKGNGPMCFVEFEDISFATKALKELYGWPLSNSVKGGIRLSFSKNPLGVRTGQAGGGAGGPSGSGPGSAFPSPLSPHSAGGLGTPGLNGGMPGGFATANGPPPGIPTPPGFINTGGANANAAINGGPMPGGPLSAPLSGGFGGLMTPTGTGTPLRSPSVTSGWHGANSGGYHDSLVGR